MSCSCNGYCNNQECTHIAPCANSYPGYSSVSAGVTIHSAHWNQLKDSINGAFAHYGLPNPAWSANAYAGLTIDKIRYENSAKQNLNNLSQAYFAYNIVTTVFSVGGLITAAGTVEIQNDSNTMRNACYCNYNCTCNINCSCNVNCVCDYP